MRAGNEAGVLTIGVTTGIYSREELESASAAYIERDLKDTANILNLIL